nr:hypothetical protein [Kibdelosporangium sp. MJ126-NF4]
MQTIRVDMTLVTVVFISVARRGGYGSCVSGASPASCWSSRW